MQIAWTTVASRADAEKIAAAAVSQGLAVCVQIDGPLTSIYRWDGKLEQTQEYRLMFKALPERLHALEALVSSLHPYETPEWVVINANQVGEKYLSWARASANS